MSTSTSEWQPIETAPKDGSTVLVWDGKQVTASWWDEKFHCEWDGEKGDNVYSGAWTDNAVASFNYEETHSYTATHWQPLPEPPEPTPTADGRAGE